VDICFPAGGPDVSVSGIQAGWHKETASELKTHSGSLCSGLLSQVQLQKSGPGPVKPSQTLSSPVLSLDISSAVVTTGAGSTIPQGRDCSGWANLPQPIPWELSHHDSGQIQEPVFHEAGHFDYWGHSIYIIILLLCERHTEGTSVWAQTQTSLHGTGGLACRRRSRLN
jgi:hypothetical protein